MRRLSAPAAQVEGRVEGLALLAGARARLDVDGDALAGLRGAEGVGLVHAHQRGDVEALLELVTDDGTAALPSRQDVGVLLPPGDVLDVGDDRLDLLPALVEAVIEGDRVEGVAEAAQAGEEADRAGGAGAGGRRDRLPGALVERLRRVAHEVLAAEAGEGAAPGREEREGIEHPRQLGQVQVHEEERIAELVLDRLEAPVADPALIGGRGGHAASSPSIVSHPFGPSGAFDGGNDVGWVAAISSQTRNALTTPSSWKPQPQ